MQISLHIKPCLRARILFSLAHDNEANLLKDKRIMNLQPFMNNFYRVLIPWVPEVICIWWGQHETTLHQGGRRNPSKTQGRLLRTTVWQTDLDQFTNNNHSGRQPHAEYADKIALNNHNTFLFLVWKRQIVSNFSQTNKYYLSINTNNVDCY